MSWIRIGRTVRAIRLRLQWRQGDLSARAHVSRSAVSLLERGFGPQLPVWTIEAIIGALGARLDSRVLWNGPELDRLLDAGHAALEASVKALLERWGWLVRVEVSFNHFGERGRIDLLAWHPGLSILLVIEIKTELVDAQALLGAMDMRTRLASSIVRPFGWVPRIVIPVIVFAEHRTTRRRLESLEPLFSRYTLRGRAATAWTRRPAVATAPTGLLWLSDSPPAAVASISRQRVRPRRRARPI